MKKKVNFKERESKVISFGFSNNLKEQFNQTETKTGGKDIEDVEMRDKVLDTKLEKKEKMEEKEAMKEDQTKGEPIKQEDEQLKNSYLTPLCNLKIYEFLIFVDNLSRNPNFDKKIGFETEIGGSANSQNIQKTLYNLISDFYISKKFIGTLRDATIYRTPKRLKDNQLKMINDWSFYREGWEGGGKEEIRVKKRK